MTRAYVLLTALPPTKGHLHLVQFAARLADEVEVILCTQPDEPFAAERFQSICNAVRASHADNVHINRIHKELPQEPEGEEGFWDMWLGFLKMFGFEPGDYIVASEMYGKTLAEYAGGRFMPYDIDRVIHYGKATLVRNNPYLEFEEILPEFQPFVRRTVTIFGAESTGKTTLSIRLGHMLHGHLLPEWARPYLETVGTEITTESMTDIWYGQRALQDHANDLIDKPFVFQDTDLFSTWGYWKMAPWDQLDATPMQLRADAHARKSDLYIITPSNIDFEHDPLRYGGDHREIPDQLWIDFAEKEGLNYVVLKSSSLRDRAEEAGRHCMDLFEERASLLDYHRQGKEYENV